MQATMVAVGGETLIVRGTYEDIAARLKRRVLGSDDGLREVTLVDGERVTINASAVQVIRAAREKARQAIGFR